MRVLIVDPVPASRLALRALLERRGVEVCADVGDVPGAIRAVARTIPDVCLLDTAVAGIGKASDAIRSIREGSRDLRVVLVSGEPTDAEGLEAAAAGASGYLSRTLASRALEAALTDVVAGGSAFPRGVETLLVAALREHVAPRD